MRATRSRPTASSPPAQRWRFRHLFVDEFQDVNPLQFRLLQGWLGDRADLCVVGDPNQAIYSWNGADVGFLTTSRSHFPGANVVRLDDNYRSTPQILAVANAVLGHDAPAPRQPAHRPAPTVTLSPSDSDEARAIARALRERHAAGVPWSHQAVLTRTNAQLVLFGRRCAPRSAVPRQGAGAFLDQPEVRRRSSSCAVNPRSTPVPVGRHRHRRAAGRRRRPTTRRDELEALVRLAGEYDAIRPRRHHRRLRRLARRDGEGRSARQGGDAVDVATFHAAKGLEWPVVFIAGLERGFVPIGHADSAEERPRSGACSTSRSPAPSASCTAHGPSAARSDPAATPARPRPGSRRSRPRCGRSPTAGDGTEWRRHIDAGAPRSNAPAARAGRSAKLDVGAHADPAVYKALKTWRSATARASGVPAYVIFHDTTLAAVAEAKPRDRSSLLALPGMGPVKAERYGDALLAVVAEHVSA